MTDSAISIPSTRGSWSRTTSSRSRTAGVEILGSWKELGRWRRHIYQGVSDTLERQHDLPAGAILETAWRDLAPTLQHSLLWGTGKQHVTFTWRGGASPIKYGGHYEGIIPELMRKHRSSKSRPHLRKLERYMRTVRCAECGGQRLNAQARTVRLATADPGFAGDAEKSLPAVCALSVRAASAFFSNLQLDATRQLIAEEVLKEIRARLDFLINVGLDYLTLDRTAPTLSGGESQRIRLAGQIGCGLVGVLYILDEPSIGLHPRDNNRLLDTLRRLRDLGNTVVVVEHDEDTMRAADHLIDFGPGPGVRGGEVVAAGSLDDVVRSPASITGKYLSGAADRRAAAAAPGGSEPSHSRRGTAQQPPEHRCRDPAGSVRLRDRRVGIRQELPGQRHPG